MAKVAIQKGKVKAKQVTQNMESTAEKMAKGKKQNKALKSGMELKAKKYQSVVSFFIQYPPFGGCNIPTYYSRFFILI